MTTATTSTSVSRPLSSDEILGIARLNAERGYRDLTPYRISLVLQADGWHVDFELKDLHVNGGGPHCVIGATPGQEAPDDVDDIFAEAWPKSIPRG